MKSNNTSSNSAYMLILLILLIPVSCRERVIPPDNGNGIHVPKLKIEAEDIGVTDCFIRLKFLDTSNVEAKIFSLTRDGQTILTSQCSSLDTLLLDEGLLPKRIYRYKAYRVEGGASVDSSMELTIETMDTTSHEFSWQIDTLGDGASSVLRDVAIINDTTVIAVGEINVKDSLGNWRNPPYNMARWNGKKWQLETTTDIGYGYGENYSVFAFGPNDIWAGGSVPKHWDGQKWTFHGSTRGYQGGFRILKIWGTSSQNLYVVGEGGNIRFFNGSSWRRLESGTTLDMRDIWGLNSFNTGYLEILSIASTVTVQTVESRILKIVDNTIIPVDNKGLSPDVRSIWFIPNKKYYIVGAGIHQKHLLTDSSWKVYLPGEVTYFYSGAVRGNNINDVFVVGSFGEVVHFNGFSWLRYFSYMPLSAGGYSGLAMKDNLVIAVGSSSSGIGSKAIILIGRR